MADSDGFVGRFEVAEARRGNRRWPNDLRLGLWLKDSGLVRRLLMLRVTMTLLRIRFLTGGGMHVRIF